MSAVRTYHFDRGRLFRNLVGLLPLAGFPYVLALTGRTDPVIWTLFGVAGAALVAGVLYTAARFKLVLSDEGLAVRGRLGTRRVRFAEVARLRVRRGPDRGPRFMGPAPYRELVLEAGGRRLVLSSLPLGEAKFEEVVAHVAARVPESAAAG